MSLKSMEIVAPVSQAFNYVPARILEIELAQPLPPLLAFDEKTEQHYQRVRCLIRLHTQPLGVVELSLEQGRLSAEEYAPRIWQALHVQINQHLQQDGLPLIAELDARGLPSPKKLACLAEREKLLTDAPFVSIVVSTHDRPEQLEACLKALMVLEYPYYEIIVVDNVPSTEATADFLRHAYADVPQVRYIREDQRGLSCARNRGIKAAKGDIIAITDDDIIVDRYWLVELVKGFSVADNVMCVTGLVLPLELEAPAQFLLEEYGGFSKGFTRRIFDMGKYHPGTYLHPYTAGRFGTGASLAFKAEFLHTIGGFDTALGTGTPAKGGEDLAIFFQVVHRGYQLVYEPAALLYHPHRRDYLALRKQIYCYGVGLTAYLTKILLDEPLLVFDLLPRMLYGLTFLLSSASSKNGKKSTQYPKELNVLELKGMLYGPLAYINSLWVTHKRRIFGP